MQLEQMHGLDVIVESDRDRRRKYYARESYESAKSEAEITVAASFGAPFEKDNTAHCNAFYRSFDALLADEERMQFHGSTAELFDEKPGMCICLSVSGTGTSLSSRSMAELKHPLAYLARRRCCEGDCLGLLGRLAARRGRREPIHSGQTTFSKPVNRPTSAARVGRNTGLRGRFYVG